nr:hypothetical protein [Tanacetum cinerariifolium]
DYYHEQNSCYNSNSFGFDHCQPPKYTVNHPIFNAHNDFLNSQNELSSSRNTIMEQMTQLTSMCEMVCQNFQKKQEEKRIEDEQAASARYWKIPACELMSVLNFEIREKLSSTTRVNLPVEDDYSPLLAYVVWIFLAYLTYPIIPPYLHPFGNEDTIFDPGITFNHFYSFKPGLSHRCGAFKKFNTHRSHLNEWLMIINGKNIPILDVLLILRNLKTRAKGFYPPSLKFLSFNWESCIQILSTNVLSYGLLHYVTTLQNIKDDV